MNYLTEVKRRAEAEVDFGPSTTHDFALSNTEFLYAWHDLAEAYGEMANDGNKRVFAKRFTWWGGLINHLQAEIAQAKAEFAADIEQQWHYVEIDDYTDHWRLQLKAALQVQRNLDKKLARLYGSRV